MLAKNVLVQLEPGQRDPPLNAAVVLEQFDVHVDRVSELGMRFANQPQLYDFTCLRTRRPRGAYRVGHPKIVQGSG